MTLLSIRNLRIYYRVGRGVYLRAVDDVSLEIDSGESVALVGESGSGKSTTALAVAKLLPPAAEILGGEIIFKGRDILRMSDSELQRIRGKEIGMIFQEPVSFLNPLIKVGEQIAEALIVHEGWDKERAAREAKRLLEKVRVPDAERVYHYYPHQLSGGMAQRVGIAIAIACNPSLLIADEPTSNLDVTVQAQVLHLLKMLNREMGMAILLISHDLGVVSGMADRVIIMYAGKIAEEADIRTIFKAPAHPYTKVLLQASRIHGEGIADVQGSLPDLVNPPKGCRFAPRCPHVMEKCSIDPPELRANNNSSRVYCWLYGG